jgi:hypothetical protein
VTGAGIAKKPYQSARPINDDDVPRYPTKNNPDYISDADNVINIVYARKGKTEK